MKSPSALEVLRNSNGFFSVPMMIILVFMTFGGFGMWSVLRHWRFLAEDQLRLDRCVGEMAQELSSTLNSLAADNQRVEVLRIAVAAAEAYPPSLPLAKAALETQVQIQTARMTFWQMKQAKWLVTQGCGKWGDRALPLPNLGLHRPFPDHLGSKPLKWSSQQAPKFRIQAGHSPRHSAAEVKNKGKGILNFYETQEFTKTEWTPFWASLH